MPGLGEFWGQSDLVGRAVAVLLLLMSVCVWVLILWKGWVLRRVELNGTAAAKYILWKIAPPSSIVVDRVWNVLRLNDGALRLLSRFLPEAADEPELGTNIVKASLHPRGLRPYIVNWVEVATFALERLERECMMFPTDEARLALRDEVRRLPGVDVLRPFDTQGGGEPISLVHLRRGDDEVRLFTMLTTIGTPLDVTAQELAIETYFPADEATERWTQSLVR
jgi:hypothetical protein